MNQIEALGAWIAKAPPELVDARKPKPEAKPEPEGKAPLVYTHLDALDTAQARLPGETDAEYFDRRTDEWR